MLRNSSRLLLVMASFAIYCWNGTALADDSVYKNFGEKAGLIRIMDDFMASLLADPRTRPFFEKANQQRIKEQLVDQFCELLEGPCKYGGAPMKPAHANLAINREHFNALVENLQIAMDKNSVPFRSQNKLLAKLAPMHRDIITK
ncbi:MAG: group 1 truncated hemoglobin [Burkholderiales bacterium]|nr:group 1 truncated hemoglobin [Burkholderiales bacterium]